MKTWSLLHLMVVEWNYLFGVLHKFKSGKHLSNYFINVLEPNFDKINPEFELNKALEPLAKNVQTEPIISGYDREMTQNRIF